MKPRIQLNHLRYSNLLSFLSSGFLRNESMTYNPLFLKYTPSRLMVRQNTSKPSKTAYAYTPEKDMYYNVTDRCLQHAQYVFEVLGK